jgi:hypothetical protein
VPPSSITERIQQTADALGTIENLTEQKFLAIGNSVEQAVAVLARLGTTFDGLLAEMQSDAVVQAKQDLALAAAEAASRADAPGQQAAALERLAQVTGSINVRISAMRQIARDVDILAINARLMSASMGEAGADFLGFAAEIRRAAKLAQDTLEHISGELTNAGRQLAAARTGVMGFAERHGDTLQSIPRRLAAAVDTIKTHDQLATNATATVATRTADIRRQVSGMIIELQLGDITRQRIQHMQEVAGTMRDLTLPSSAAQGEWRALSPGGFGALLQTAGELAAAQLRDTAGELDTEAERVANGLVQLAADARDISSLGEQAYGATDQQHRGFMTELEEDLRATEALFEGLRAAREDTEQRITDVLAIAHRLSGNIDTLRGLEGDIRIMGLNTTLKCGRLGLIGRPLSVIAQELRDCGGRTATHADAALADLKRLAELAGTLSATDQDPRDAAVGNFTQRLLGAVDLLGRSGRALSDALAGLDADSGAAARLLQDAARDFSVRHDLGEVLNSTADALSGIAGEQGGQATTESAAVQRLLGRFAAVYTMARERQVHARFGGPVAQEASRAAEPDLADVLF